ncbi:YwqJ-related putative deaminase [Streptomyces albus]|uniref:YwqJ-related putative deaminase n=1 Tax=Streptomyces albus TaxID=1888 RepID=UPI0004C4A429|nr:YwqJ-related putative deaminase [Streptomyces albus]
MIKPEAIPQFTGDLGQLEKDATGLGNDADNIRETGKGVHTQFQGLSAFYTAPEAEALFASTKPVQDKADEFADDLEKVKSALDEYAAEVRPLAAKLKQLKADAAAFVASVEGDDEWKYDGDKIDEHNALQSEVTATVAAFWEAERTAANKITALVGGTQYRANDGSDGKNMYGFSAEDMKDAEVPWGTAENEKYHWYEVHQHIKSFVWDGLIVDGVWGTIKGLGTLVGFDGWEAMKDAWKGLGMLVVGTALYTSPLAYAVPDSALPQWMKDSKEVAKQTGKALLAWDTWSENPARAAGAVTFNVLTSITGAGNIAKGGTVAKVASVAGKAGAFLDPMTHIASVVGKAGQAMKIGDVLAGLKNLNLGKIDIPALPDGATLLPDGRLELPDGTVKVPDTPLQLADGTVHVPEGTAPRVPSELPSGAVLMPDGSVLHPDGKLQLSDGNMSTAPVKVEPHKVDLATPDEAAVRVPDPELELVGAGARNTPPGAVAQLGDAGNPSAITDNTAGGGTPPHLGPNAGDTALGGTARTGDNLPTASTNPVGPEATGRGPLGDTPLGGVGRPDGSPFGGAPARGDISGNGGPESANTGGGSSRPDVPGGGDRDGAIIRDRETPQVADDLSAGHEGSPLGQEPARTEADSPANLDETVNEQLPGQTDVPTGAHPLPDPGPGEKVLARIDDSRLTRTDGLVTQVDGRPVGEFLDSLAQERGAAYRDAKEAGSFPRKQTGACVGAVMDRRTGVVIEGINGKNYDIIPDDNVHPTLAARYDQIADNPPHSDHPLGHAEVKAANELLWERRKRGLPDDESALAELQASVEFPFLKDKETGAPGRRAPFCANCHHMLDGVRSNHGRFTDDPPSDENWIPG